MPRLSYILATLLVPACAAPRSAGSSSSAQFRSSEPQRGTPPQVESPRPGPEPVAKSTSPAQESDEDLPDWLKKKPPGQHPPARAFDERMAEEHRQYLQEFEDQAARINLTDGVDAAEAEFIGGAYFLLKFGICGATEKATDGGGEWLMRPRIGATGQPLENFIRVDKRTGDVRYGSGANTEARTAIDFERKLLQKNVDRFSKRGPAR